MATIKAVSANSIKNNGGVVAFNAAASGPITRGMSKLELHLVDKTHQYPVSGTDSGKARSGGNFAQLMRGFFFRGFGYDNWSDSGFSLFKAGVTGSITHAGTHVRTGRNIRYQTGWDYVTGAPEGTEVRTMDYRLPENTHGDDSINKSNNGEFVFIPSGGKVPTKNAGNARYYTYGKLY